MLLILNMGRLSRLNKRYLMIDTIQSKILIVVIGIGF